MNDEGLADVEAAKPLSFTQTFTQELVFRREEDFSFGTVKFPRWKRSEQVRESAQFPLSQA
jgi:hypothetical protein